MNQYIDIGEIMEIVPDAMGVVNVLDNKPPTPEASSDNSNIWNWVILGLVIAGTGYIAYRLYKDRNEDPITRNKP
jgi:hypothetical protein